MSLIQEALKRQQEEGGPGPKDEPKKEALPGIGAAPDTPPVPEPPAQELAPPSAPPPLPKDEVVADEPAGAIVPPEQTPELKAANAKKPVASKQMIIIGGVVAVAVIGGAVMMFSGGDSDVEPQEDPIELIDPDNPTDTDTSDSSTDAGGGVLDIEPVAVVSTQPADATPTAAPEEPKVFIEWPVLSLTAVMGRGTAGSAMINGQLIDVGQEVEGVLFVSIGNQGVHLEYKGEKQFLKVGNSTM